ncbi:hypothetical protein HKX48_005816 [Thoreauomyces humboldtii]|nr:hypothetical protein HKX48_005816 [Thoreauomyces humboldtii]
MSQPLADASTLSEAELHENHCQAQADAVRVFRGAILDKDVQTHVEELKDQLARFDGIKVIGSEYHTLLILNHNNSQALCEGVRKDLHETLTSKVSKKSFKTFPAFESAVQDTLERYWQKARGPAASVVGMAFAEALDKECQMQALHFKISDSDKEALRLRIEQRELRDQIQMQNDAIEIKRQKAEALEWQHWQESEDLKNQLQEDHDKWVEEQENILEQRLNSAQEWQERQLRKRDAENEQELEAVKRMNNQQIQALKAELARDRATYENTVQQFNDRLRIGPWDGAPRDLVEPADVLVHANIMGEPQGR